MKIDNKRMIEEAIHRDRCSICKKYVNELYKIDEDTLEQIDFYGVPSLTELQQAVYEGMNICVDCYDEGLV